MLKRARPEVDIHDVEPSADHPSDRVGAAVTDPAPTVGTPVVTVLLLTYNQRPYVERALAGILEQRLDVPLRVVVHDDASTDGTQDAVRAAAERHPGRLELILQTENQLSRGVSITARLLLDVDSEFVALCEGDDFWTDPDKLQQQVDFLRANPWCSVCHHDFSIVSDGGRADYEAGLRRYLDSLSWRTSPRVEGRRLALGNFVRTCTAMIRRSSLRDELLRAAHDVRPGDHMLFCAAAEHGDVGFINRDMACYRLHDGGSWSMLDPAQREERQLGVYWFLAGQLRGPMQHAVQEVLLHLLATSATQRQRYQALRELTGQIAQLAQAGSQTADALEATLARSAALQERLSAVTAERDLLASVTGHTG
ncbi:MAG: glycosyltransferase [Kineosporiaceae bacterium]|nr:glycosyltransferase [Kineosporiaceae bacterium]